MRQIVQFSIFVLIVASYAFAQPTVSAVYNAASYASAPLDANSKPIGNNNISQGSIIVIFGTGLGPASLI